MKTTQYVQSRRNLLKLAGAAAVSFIAGAPQAHAAPQRSAPLFFTEAGTGKNLMFLHGWTCDSHDWSWQLPHFENRFRVLAVDLRGHGRSQVMPPGSYTPAQYVADIEELIATRYPGEKFMLVGHSMGGQIAARLGLKRPDLVSAVVSVDGALGFSDAVGLHFGKMERELQVREPGVVVPPFFQTAYAPGTHPAIKRWHARRVQGMPPHVVRESFGPLFSGREQVGIGQASEKFCKSLKLPFYHLCRDPAQAERMRPWFSHPKSKVDVWTDAGHWIMQDRPEEVNAAITAWIGAL